MIAVAVAVTFGMVASGCAVVNSDGEYSDGPLSVGDYSSTLCVPAENVEPVAVGFVTDPIAANDVSLIGVSVLSAVNAVVETAWAVPLSTSRLTAGDWGLMSGAQRTLIEEDGIVIDGVPAPLVEGEEYAIAVAFTPTEDADSVLSDYALHYETSSGAKYVETVEGPEIRMSVDSCDET